MSGAVFWCVPVCILFTTCSVIAVFRCASYLQGAVLLLCSGVHPIYKVQCYCCVPVCILFTRCCVIAVFRCASYLHGAVLLLCSGVHPIYKTEQLLSAPLYNELKAIIYQSVSCNGRRLVELKVMKKQITIEQNFVIQPYSYTFHGIAISLVFKNILKNYNISFWKLDLTSCKYVSNYKTKLNVHWLYT